MPACSYASLAALRVTVFTSNIVGLRSCQGSEVRAEAATQTGFVVYWRAFSADMRGAGAPPAPGGGRAAGRAGGRGVGPVAQALVTFTTGTPVAPISFMIRWPIMALDW